MKTKFFTTISLVLMSISVFAQSNVWTKDDRTNIYNDCLSYITKYVGLTSEQRKTISKCYLENITKKYDKQSYQNLIDVEIQDLRESTLSLCAKSSGVELSEQKKVEPKIEPPKEVGNKELPATKENLIGHWTDDNSDFWLFETGDYKMQYNDGKSARGTWKIENNQLTLNKEKFLGKSEKSFKILLFTKNKFVYQSMSKKAETLTATKIN